MPHVEHRGEQSTKVGFETDLELLDPNVKYVWNLSNYKWSNERMRLKDDF